MVQKLQKCCNSNCTIFADMPFDQRAARRRRFIALALTVSRFAMLIQLIILP